MACISQPQASGKAGPEQRYGSQLQQNGQQKAQPARLHGPAQKKKKARWRNQKKATLVVTQLAYDAGAEELAKVRQGMNEELAKVSVASAASTGVSADLGRESSVVPETGTGAGASTGAGAAMDFTGGMRTFVRYPFPYTIEPPK